MRHLRHFVAVAEERSFSRAAMRVHLAQSALSTQIRQLEQRIGAILFERSTRSVVLTPAGETLLEDAREIIARTDAAVEAVQRVARGQVGCLRVGTLGHAAGEMTNAIFDRFARVHPDVDVQRKALDYVSILESLRQGTTDVNFLFLPYSDADLQGLSVLPLLSEPRVVAMSSSHRLAGRDALTFDDLADEVFVAGPEDVSSTWREFWLGNPSRRGASVRLSSHPASNVDEFLHVVSRGDAVDTVPASVARYYARPEVCFVPLEDEEPAVIALGWRTASQNVLVHDFVEAAQTMVAQPA